MLLAEYGKHLHCAQNHCFDIAKQGYVNLLPVQQKRSKSPGDDKNMVRARHCFLNQGYYQPLSEAINDRLARRLPTPMKGINILDAGCGEGYYTQRLTNHLEATLNQSVCTTGIDISKAAILSASKRSKQIRWIVASLKSLPLSKLSQDLIVSVFSPINTPMFQQCLKDQGYLLVVTAGNNHLQALKEKLYDTVLPFDQHKIMAELETQWKLVGQDQLSFNFQLSNREDIESLLAMTPHSWRISPQKKTRLQSINELSCQTDFLITLWQKAPKTSL
ncbi:MAG: methyltransferase domain-containing protein [Pseudomonadales bacterium]|nr:methyltransferase domain-containing protein [Pseudomonadales bacterium]